MEKELIPYKQALELKELGFDISCYERYYNGELQVDYGQWNGHSIEHIVSAPLYQQAFRWFREKYNLNGWSFPCCDEDNSYSFTIFKNHSPYFNDETLSFLNFNSNEEAELECLKKLIEIVKQ